MGLSVQYKRRTRGRGRFGTSSAPSPRKVRRGRGAGVRVARSVWIGHCGPNAGYRGLRYDDRSHRAERKASPCHVSFVQ